MRSQRQTGPRSLLRQSDAAPISKGKKTFLLPPDELSRMMSAANKNAGKLTPGTLGERMSSVGEHISSVGEQHMSSVGEQHMSSVGEQHMSSVGEQHMSSVGEQHMSSVGEQHMSSMGENMSSAKAIEKPHASQLGEEAAHRTTSEHSSIDQNTMVSGRRTNISGVLKWQMWSPEEEADRQRVTSSPQNTMTSNTSMPNSHNMKPSGDILSPQNTRPSENVLSPQNTKTLNTSVPKPSSYNKTISPESVPHAVRKWQEWRPDTNAKPSKPKGQSEICGKLSELGVTVSPPKRYQSFAAKVTKANNEGRLDEKLISSRPQSPKNGSARGGKRGGKQHRGKPRASKWATKAEMAPKDPKRHDRSPWSEKSDDAISCAMTEWSGNKYSTLHIRKYHEMTGLADWNGGWAPPPLDWDNREAFRSEQSVEQIDQWIDDVEVCLDEVERAVTIADITNNDDTIYRFTVQDIESMNVKQVGEIAPRYWYEPVIDQLEADEYFDMHLGQGMPDPMDPGDLEHSQSWWQRYNTDVSNSHFLNSVQCNQDLGVDPTDENEANRRKREADIGSWNKAQMRNLLEISKREAKKEAKRLEKRELAREMRKARARGDFDDKRCKPQVDLYIRMAEEKDIPAIHYIYNHYVERTFAAPEMEPLSREAFQKKYQDLSYKKHNIIVACERGYTVEGRLGNPDVDLDPKVVGFAFSDDFHDFHGMYRYACKVEFYVHDAYTKKGIGMCLVDRIVALLDPGYSPRYGYDIEDGFIQTPCRPFTNVLVHFNYTKSDKLEWMTRFLNGSFGFKCIMNLENVGVKYEENVHLAIFHHRTGLEIDPAKPYPLEEYGPFEPRKQESIPDRIYTRGGNRLGCSTQTSEADFCV